MVLSVFLGIRIDARQRISLEGAINATVWKS
jgi:hypothetical protein